jgi:serine O-acetyltransferase
MYVLEKPLSLQTNSLSEVTTRIIGDVYKDIDDPACFKPYPARKKLVELSTQLAEALLPEYYCLDRDNRQALQFHVGHLLAAAVTELRKQISLALDQDSTYESHTEKEEVLERVIEEIVASLPNLRQQLLEDAQFALQRDPAARSIDEIILCYPGFKALLYHRMAHLLFKAGLPLLSRIISEHSHSETGIDIHPGARIESPMFMDHGTGIVIGETCRIGKRVTIYQGVTLGAKSFPTEDDGSLVKGIDRHPIVEDDVVIYSGATILGRITLGRGSVIGGNVWVTRDVPPKSRLLQSAGKHQRFTDGAGI